MLTTDLTTDHIAGNQLMNSNLLTPAQAAKLANVSRPTISRMLNSREIAGIRDNSGRWKIECSEIEAWLKKRPASVHDQAETSDHEQSKTAVDQVLERERSEHFELKLLYAKMETTNAAQLQQIEDLRADRDRWHALATTPKPTLIERIRGSLRRP